MKFKSFIVASILCLVVGVLLAQTPHRVVLVEEGTGTGCQWCPRGDVYGKNLLNHFPDNVAYVAVHGFNANDPMYYEEHNNILVSQGLEGYPNGVVNRSSILSMDNVNNTFADLNTYVTASPPANVMVETEYNESTRELIVDISIYLFDLLFGEYRLGGIIVEDGVTGPSPGYDQSNAYAGGDEGPMDGFEELPSPIPASIRVYNHVSRQLLGGAIGEPGSLPGMMTQNSTHLYQFTYTIPEDHNWEYTRVVGILYDGSGKVVNAGLSNYLGGNTNAPPFFHSEGKVEGFVGLTYDYQIVTHDPEHENLNLSLIEAPAWLSLQDNGNGFGNLVGVPPVEGQYPVTIRVTDSNWDTDQTYVLEVGPAIEDWIQLGDPGFNQFSSVNVKMDTDAAGNLYAFSASFDGASAEVYKYENEAWVQIGANLSLNGAFHTDFAVSPDGIPYVADRSSVYHFESGNWVQLGTPFLTGGTILDPALAFNSSGELFAVATTASSTSASNHCFKWSGTNWIPIGSEISSTAVWNRMIIKPDGNPIVIYGTVGPNTFFAEVSSFEGGEWHKLGGGPINSNEWTRWCFDIATTSDGTIYAINSTSSDRVLDLYFYDSSTDTWQIHTPEIAQGIEDFSASLTIDSENNLYVAYNDVNVGGGVSVQFYDGNLWKHLGVKGFTPPARHISLTLDNNDNPYVGYVDLLEGERMSAKKYVDLTTATDELINLYDFQVFPNPVREKIALKYKSGKYFEIYNNQGLLMSSGKLNGLDNTVNIQEIYLTNFPIGTYFIRVIDGNIPSIVSFIKVE